MKYCKECVMPDTRPGITFSGGYAARALHIKIEKMWIGTVGGRNLRRSAINIGE